MPVIIWFSKIAAPLYLHNRFPFVIYKPPHFKLSGYSISELMESLQPGDIIFTRTDGFFSNFVINGFWTHAVYYIGNNEVVHATTKGVIRAHVLSVLTNDNVAVCRMNGITQLQNAEAICNAVNLATLGIKYDWNFGKDNGMIYCSELIQVLFQSIVKGIFKDDDIFTPQELYNHKRVSTIISKLS